MLDCGGPFLTLNPHCDNLRRALEPIVKQDVHLVVRQFEIIKTSEYPNFVTPAKAGVQNKNLDSGFRRNDR